MYSFPYWLLTAMALGALLGTFIHPSWIEILIVWAVLTAACSFWRGMNNRRALAKDMKFTKGLGDVGQFIVQQALKRGARPVTTTGLPEVGGDWSYSEDQYGVILHLPRERFSEIETLLHQAFGAPAQAATDTTGGGKLGWYSPKTIGVSLQFGFDSNQTQVIVLRPQPADEIIKRIRSRN